MKSQEFKSLVAKMRDEEKCFWRTRDKDALARSLALEKRTDEEIEKCNVYLRNHPEYTPDAKSKIFYDLVHNLRITTKAFFQEKRRRCPEKARVQQLYEEVRRLESLIDEALHDKVFV